MIQVIKRAFKVLETLSPNTRITLDSLSKATQLNKGTLCNILKTLIEIGYVEKTGAGSYKLSPKLLELTTPFSKARIVEELSQRHTQVLAKETRESCVASTLRENQVHIIAQTQYERSLMINVYSVYKDLSLYGSVSGQVLVSHLSAKSQAALTESIGFPGKEWNNINNLEDLKRSSREIVDTRLCTSWNREKEILSLAVPILDAQGTSAPPWELPCLSHGQIMDRIRLLWIA
ncbi:MAG: helix-turn-helix domain-containing protein [Victivallales bacterium]